MNHNNTSSMGNMAYLCNNKLISHHYPLYSKYSKKYIQLNLILNKKHEDTDTITIKENSFTFEQCKFKYNPGLIRCQVDLDEHFTICNDDYWTLIKYIFMDLNEMNFVACHLPCDREKIKYYSLINYEKLKIVPSMDDYQIRCLLEIKQMKCDYLLLNKINIYDLIMRNNVYVSIKSYSLASSLLSTSKLLENYKIYYSIIKKLLNVAINRYNLCKILYKKMFIQLNNNTQCIYLGYCIVDNICKYLSYTDLDTLCSAYE